MEKSVLQLCKQKKLKKNEREVQIGVFVENAKSCLSMQRVSAAVRKMKSRIKFLTVTFFISNYIIWIKQAFGVRNNRNLLEIKI